MSAGTSAGAWSGYRRRVRIVPEPSRVDVEMEDDCHHFGVTVFHDATTIERVETREPRHPWTTCVLAGTYLRDRMAGVTLAHAADVENQRQHCTHLYDLFVMAAAHAHDEAETFYDIRVDDPVGGVKLAELDRDGATLLRWRMGDDTARDGVPGGNFRALETWSRTLPLDLAEAARMLRRGVMVSGGRSLDFPAGQTAGALLPQMSGACFTFQPERAGSAVRMPGSLRDYAQHPEKMLNGESDDRRSDGAASR